jgi:chloramphenicol 3-O-phosphotransferase
MKVIELHSTTKYKAVAMYKDGGEVVVDDVTTKELANMINNFKVYEGKIE